MFTGFTSKISSFLLKKISDSKNKEIHQFIDEIIDEISKILLTDDVHYLLVEKISNDCRVYLNNNRQEIFNSPKTVIQNLLKETLGSNLIEEPNFQFKRNIVLIGDNGSGKTTVASKLAFYLSDTTDKKVKIVNLDHHRSAAHDQIMENIKDSNIKLEEINTISTEEINQSLHSDPESYAIFDTCGLINMDQSYINTIKNSIKEDVNYIYIGNSLVGPSSYYTIETVKKTFNIDGIIITNCDGEARCGLFLSASFLFNRPVILISDNELIRSDDNNENLTLAKKDKIIKRLLGLYDESGMKEAVEKISKSSSNLIDKIMSKVFDYNTLAEFLDSVLNNRFKGILGSMGNMQAMDHQKKRGMREMLIIIGSMTKKERLNPSLFKNSDSITRIRRISKGTNITESQVQNSILLMNNMLSSLAHFTDQGLPELGNMENMDEITAKLKDPEFLKKYVQTPETENLSNTVVEEPREQSNTQSMDNNPYMNSAALAQLKNFTPRQIYEMIQGLPPSLLKGMPGMSGVDPAMIKNITLEQIEEMMKNI